MKSVVAKKWMKYTKKGKSFKASRLSVSGIQTFFRGKVMPDSIVRFRNYFGVVTILGWGVV